jgi:hypothetical protein
MAVTDKKSGRRARSERTAATSEPASIMVFNFDAVEQTRLWVKEGPRRATEILIGALRTALLFGATVVVDRNQLLEGIFFIAMPPDRLAWHLGLEPSSALPLSIRLLPPRAQRARTQNGPWRLSNDKHMWGLGPDALVREVEDNYLDVALDAKRVSSPLIALTGDYSQAIPAPSLRGGVSVISVTDKWTRSDPAFIPQSVWQEHDPVVSLEIRERGRRAWIDAMKQGRVSVIAGTRSAPNPIGPALEDSRPSDEVKIDRRLSRIVQALIEVEEPGAADHFCTRPHRPFGGENRRDGQPPCTRSHASTRSLIVRWLDGEAVPELKPPRLPIDLSPEDRRTYCTAALNWWIGAYYRAITSRDDYRLLTLFNTISTEDGLLPRRLSRLEATLGLRPTPGTPLQRLRSRLSPRRTSDVRIDGSIVEELAAFTPDQFVRLQRFDVVGSNHLLRDPSGRHLVDLALALREMSSDTSSRRKRIHATTLRAVLVIIPGIGLALVDRGVVDLSGPSWAVVLTSAAVAIALPWEAFKNLFQMRRGSLQSTLSLRRH